MQITRHDFLKGILASFGFGAIGGQRLFAVPPGWKPSKKPNLVFGVISDTHLRTVHGPSGRIGHNWPDKYFTAALEYFNRQDVDAVVHCGDMAHRGQVEEMQFHANAWRRVFPHNKTSREKTVVKLFVTGNHDKDGSTYGNFVADKYPDPVERAKHVLDTDMAANWERIWREKYEPVWHKEVNGYHFFGRHWGASAEELARLINGHAAEFRLDEGNKPFFFMQHRRPYGDIRKDLRARRNAVAFFGHNHWSDANWNMVYRYGNSLTAIEVGSCEPRGCTALTGDGYITKATLEGRENTGRGRHGLVVYLYDDMMLIARREFGEGGSLGNDWVMTFEDAKEHPFSRSAMQKKIGEPQFHPGATLAIAPTAIEKPAKEKEPAKKIPALGVNIPLADANPDSRVYAYEIAIKGESGKKELLKAVYATGCNLAMGHEPNKGVTTLAIPLDELPKKEKLSFTVTPLTSLGTRGRPISAIFDNNTIG